MSSYFIASKKLAPWVVAGEVADEIKNIPVLMTITGGNVVYEA